MRHTLSLLAAITILAAPASAQTMRVLAYNTNGQILSATNVAFTNSVSFGEIKADTLIMPKLGAPLILANITSGNLSANGTLSGGTVTTSAGGAIIVVSGGSLRFDAGATISNSPTVNFANTTNAAQTRTNLGLGLPLLTNGSITNFQSALFSTNTAPTDTTNVSAWTTIQIGTNAFRVPLYK
jgi:hypothetical protein